MQYRCPTEMQEKFQVLNLMMMYKLKIQSRIKEGATLEKTIGTSVHDTTNCIKN